MTSRSTGIHYSYKIGALQLQNTWNLYIAIIQILYYGFLKKIKEIKSIKLVNNRLNGIKLYKIINNNNWIK